MKELFKTKVVLIVEDHDSMRTIMKGFLRNLGFVTIEEAGDGTKAWQIVQDTPIDLIVSDWNMPVMSGLELLKRVRGNPLYEDIPFLMVTSEAHEDLVVTAIDAGVTHYIVKPFTLDTFSSKITTILTHRPAS